MKESTTSKMSTMKKSTHKGTVVKVKPLAKHGNGLTELVFILDRSGSMGGLETDTIGGFNSMIDKQKRQTGDALVSTVLFDDRMEVLHNRIPLPLIRPLTSKQYFVRGSTALLDAVGRAIRHIGDLQKYTQPANRPKHTLIVITTDGQENASREYSALRIRQMIERQKTKYGWEFIFLGANIDSIAVAADIGLSADQAVNYVHDSLGTQMNYACVSEAVTNVRRGVKLNAFPAGRAWRQAIDRDYQARKK